MVLEWAARYLRDCGFRPAGELSAELAEGRRWVETHSIPLSALTLERVKVLRDFYCRTGLEEGTARTYWGATVIPFLNWLMGPDQIPRSVVKGQASLVRDVEGERPDPRRIPDPVQMERIAARFEVRHGAPWGTFVRMTTRCALRLSEALDVRGRASSNSEVASTFVSRPSNFESREPTPMTARLSLGPVPSRRATAHPRSTRSPSRPNSRPSGESCWGRAWGETLRRSSWAVAALSRRPRRFAAGGVRRSTMSSYRTHRRFWA